MHIELESSGENVSTFRKTGKRGDIADFCGFRDCLAEYLDLDVTD